MSIKYKTANDTLSIFRKIMAFVSLGLPSSSVGNQSSLLFVLLCSVIVICLDGEAKLKQVQLSSHRLALRSRPLKS